MKYWEHGTFSMTVSGSLVIVKAVGPFNEQLFVRYQRELEKALSGIKAERWCHVAVLQGLSTFTPSVLTLVDANFAWRKRHGMVSDAVVFAESEGANLTKQQLETCYKKIAQTYRFFDNADDAISWSNANLNNPTS